MESLFDLPLIGLVFQLLAYLIRPSRVSPQASLPGQRRSPLGHCAGSCVSGVVVNIGIEGMMLTGAFVAWIVGSLFAPAFVGV